MSVRQNSQIGETMASIFAWFATAAAKYLDLGLNTDQRHRLFIECSEVAREKEDLKLFVFTSSNAALINFSRFQNEELKQLVDISNNIDELLPEIVHYKKESYDDDICEYEKRLAEAKESGNEEDEMMAYLMLGATNFSKEKYADAILYGEEGLAMALNSGCKEAEMAAYSVLGVAHFAKDENDDAILYSKKGLAIAQKSDSREAEKLAYLILGACRLKKGEFDDAILYMVKYSTVSPELSGARVTEMNAYTVLDCSINTVQEENYFAINSLMHFYHYLAQNRYEQAILYLEEVVETMQRDDSTSSSRTLLYMKHMIPPLYIVYGEYDKAIQCYQDILKYAKMIGDDKYVAKCHYELATLYLSLGQTEKAEKSYEEALKGFEDAFNHLGPNDRFKIAFIDHYKISYKMHMMTLVQRNMKEEALVLSDQYRAKALKDLLISRYGMKEESTVKDALQYSDVQSLVCSGGYTLLLYATGLMDAFLFTFLVEAGHELVFSDQLFPECDLCLEKLVDKTFDDMNVREVVNCEDRSLDLVHDDLEEKKNHREDESTKLLRGMKEQMQWHSTLGDEKNPSEFENITRSQESGLEIMYHKLISSVECFIKQEELVVVPEGPLCKVPFAALRDPKTKQYLSETKRIRMAPSITFLKFLQECPSEHHSNSGALIIGAPLVGRVMMDGEEKEVSFLEGALDEADDIASILGVRKIVAAAATKLKVLERLHQGVSVVHIAAHGNLSKGSIVLAPSSEVRATKIPEEEDYMLTMADVQQAQVRAQLVVLSCCHSGRGEIKAEGVVGMCRAFLASGARAVVGSLWAVHDEATRAFMVKFYTYLKDGKSASTSLHLTINDMRRMPEYSEPKYWAPFFLMGDDVTLQL